MSTNYNILVEMLKTEVEYWVAQISNEPYDVNSRVMLICKPEFLKSQYIDAEITWNLLREFETEYNRMNIYLNPKYGPFQSDQCLEGIINAFPITEYIDEFVLIALSESLTFIEYRDLFNNLKSTLDKTQEV